MMRQSTRVIVAMMAIWLIAAAAVRAAEQTPKLELEPCTIELVDGRVVEGHLAVAYEMDAHLIVYSPRLATVRSFLKDHVHALTVGGERQQLNAKRELTDEDKTLLGEVAWPDEPPAEGRKPAYATQTWEAPKRLIVWAKPGSAGRFSTPANWLVNGKPAETLAKTDVWTGPTWHRGRSTTDLDKDTDILMPAAAKGYSVRDRGSYLARHITVEANASLHRNINSVYGNLWVAEAGNLDGGGCATLRGTKHTFFLNGDRYTGELPETPEAFSKLMKAAKHFARKWIVRKDDTAASITIMGTCRSGDETHWIRGVTILAEGAVVSIGGRCSQTIGRDATFIMKSGSVLGKNGNQLYKDDMRLKGAFLAGTPDEPITRNCYLGLSIKDPKGTYPKSDRRPGRGGFRLNGTAASSHGQGLTMAPGARFAVHTARPGEAKLVITWHGITDSGCDDGTKAGYFDEIAASERTTNMLFLEDVKLNDITLDWFGKHEILMPNPDLARQWKRIDYGKHNRARGAELFGKLSLSAEAKKDLAKWREKVAKGEVGTFYAGATLFTRSAGTPTIDTPVGHYPAGRPVTVRLSNETKGLQMRYTLDGKEPSPSTTLYEKPFELTEDAVVKAAAFKDGKRVGEVAEGRFSFTAPDDVELQAAASPGKTSPGLAYKYYEGTWDGMPDVGTLSPKASGVATELSLEAVEHSNERFALVFEGLLDVADAGGYTLYVSTGKEDACEVYVGGQRVVANSKDELESFGFVGLAAGKHPIKIVYKEIGWGQKLSLRLRKLDETTIQDVTAEILSH
ncbi:MAG: chitobiase/beta-hexosaminidase C-terminal domain-containing protein [Phycisphaerae bacterium]|nr:chitobiase/beta-hexosaminidase C-terminal domain-containing protein [Phycisphaerae bacterium]